ncbi:MAG: NAD(P)-dependent alcohol dehydrogenase [Sphingomonadales bacterium]|nr:NAD(P)-dependent alcohol dehydrogenase [Sphingomonadales bacterium]MDE2171122.1 NAD(P)-dependent alcohol dehydrogenase [Sphingomonadales bacterium]
MDVTAAVVRQAGGPFAIETLALEAIRPDEVLVRIVGTGLCHTDLVVRDQVLPTPLPAVLGHEGAGVVEAVGERVSGLAPGDHVVLGFAACRDCAQCRAGHPSYCEHFAALNFGGCRADGSKCLHDGSSQISSHFFGQSSFATHAVLAAHNAVKVAKDVPLALLGPLGCGIMTGAGTVFHALDLHEGESLLVIGGGPVGLSAVMAARVRGAARIVLADPVASRREAALDLGASDVIDVAGGDLAQQVKQILPEGVSCVLDSSGVVQAIEGGVAALAPRGRLAMVGVPRSLDAAISLNIVQMLSRGLKVCGVTEGDADPQIFLPQLIDLYRQGRFPFDRLIATYPLDRINEAVTDQHAGRCVKVVLIMPE